MGTSISNRSPDTPRWRAVQAAYVHQLPDERIAIEIARAAEPWASAFSSTTLTEYVDAVRDAFDELPSRLANSSPEAVVRAIGEYARDAAVRSAGDVSTLPIAERALQRTLIACLRSERLLSETSSEDAAAHWTRQRGNEPRDLVQRFVREFVDQFGRHVVGRDVGALVGPESGLNTQGARDIAERIANALASRAVVAFADADTADVSTAASQAFAAVFAQPPNPRPDA
jgi:hypothetical protein